MAQRNGTGQGGKSFQDRELAASVRTLGLEQIKEVLMGTRFKEDSAFHKAVLLKLAGTLLPRLTEHSGPDGGPIETSDISKMTDEELARIAKGSGKGTSKKGTS